MAEQIHIEKGAPPWAPSDESERVATLNQWNVPTAGVLRQGGSFYEFRCFAGALDEWSIWLYRETYPEILPDLLAGKKDRHPWDETSFMTPCGAALVHGAEGIVEFAYIDNVDLVRSSLSGLMVDVPFEVQQQMWDEIDAA